MNATKTVSDDVLWAQARAGDAEAFGEIYARHARAVHDFCLWRTADPQAAEDAAATVFLEAWRRRDRLSLQTDSAAALLLGIANNVVRGHWRTSRRHGKALARLRAAVPRDGAGPESAAIARIDAFRHVREATKAIRSLPPREREVLALIADRDLSYEEAASTLGVPIGTVRSRLARARRRLRSTNFGSEQKSNGEERDMSKRTTDTTALLS
ncbi:MAG TPA: RNA polymerase sigma factor [Solirubrobacterales bacterium]|nr:RNA polymerase sigma factor [Solirubrobacterales bacterium]